MRLKIKGRYWGVTTILGEAPWYRLSVWRKGYLKLTCYCCKGDFFIGPFLFYKHDDD